jgi:hypothetical protein
VGYGTPLAPKSLYVQTVVSVESYFSILFIAVLTGEFILVNYFYQMKIIYEKNNIKMNYSFLFVYFAAEPQRYIFLRQSRV